jgi:fluoride exporter
MIRTILLIALGGGIGSVLRYVTAMVVHKHYAGLSSPIRPLVSAPLATFITNIIGCLLIGLFAGFIEKNYSSNPDLKWFFITGFCGGYTTFSAFAHENYSLLQHGNPFLALGYIGMSIFVGIAAVWLGLFLTK